MQNYKKNFVTRTLAWVLAAVMVIAMVPVGVFAETFVETKDVGGVSTEITKTTDWSIDEKKEAEMSYWRLSNLNELTVVANAEGIKTPSINYIGTYINEDGDTVIRVSFRMFQNLSSAVWDKLLFKFDKDFYKLINFDNPKTGMYKGRIDGRWHDSSTYSQIVPFVDCVSSISGSVNVKEQSLKNNENKIGASARIEIPIDLVLNSGKTVDDIVGQPHVQMRILDSKYERVFCVAGTGKAKDDPENNDDSKVDKNTLITPYNSYTFMTFVPSKNNNSDVGTVEDYNIDYQFYAANSYAKYNEKGKYLDVFHKQSKLASGEDIGGENFAFRQVFNEKFAKVLKPQDESGTVAQIFPASQQGDMWSNSQPVNITKSDLNNSDNSLLNSGFTGIQVASTKFNTKIGTKFAGLKTVLVTDSAKISFLNGTTTEFNSGLPTITRYYIDPEKLAAEGLTNDDLASFDFYSTFILEGSKKFIEYSAFNNTGSDIVIPPNSNLAFSYSNGPTSTPNTSLNQYSLTIGEGPYKIELRSNFKHTGKPRGLNYEYYLVPGMTIKDGEKIIFRTMKYNEKDVPRQVELTLPVKNGNKTITLKPGTNGPEMNTPRRLNFITTYAGGSASQTNLPPDVDEIFTDSTNITGRTKYNLAKMKLYYPDNTDFEFTIDDNPLKDVVVNGQTFKGYTFTTDNKSGIYTKNGVEEKTARAFEMPTLKKDMPIALTNRDELKASVASDKVFEQVQAKVTFKPGGPLGDDVSYEKIAPLNKDYLYKMVEEQDPSDNTKTIKKFVKNDEYKGNGFGELDKDNEVIAGTLDNIKVDTNQVIDVDGQKMINYINHDGKTYDINNTDTAIANEQKQALAKRQWPVVEKDGSKFINGKVLLGWTTVKLEDDVNGTAVEKYNKILEENKVVTELSNWNDAKNNAYVYNSKSPIEEAITVYGVWGEPAIRLHSNFDKDAATEGTQEDVDTQVLEKAVLDKLKANADPTTIDATLKEVYGKDEFKRDGYSLVGFSRDPNADEPDINVTNAGTLIKDLYLRDGDTFKLAAKGSEKTSSGTVNYDYKFDVTKGLDLYAVWKPDFTVKATKKWLDEKGSAITLDSDKTANLKFALIGRPAVGTFGNEVVVENATYHPIQGTIKPYTGEDITWGGNGEAKLPGYDSKGRRMSYLLVELTNDEQIAAFNNSSAKWADYKLKITEPKYEGGQVTEYSHKEQLVSLGTGEDIDSFTGATVRLHTTNADPQGINPHGDVATGEHTVGYFSTTGYILQATNTKVKVEEPTIDQAYTGDTTITVNPPEAMVDRITVTLPDNTTAIFKKNDAGTGYETTTEGTTSAQLKVEDGKLIIEPTDTLKNNDVVKAVSQTIVADVDETSKEAKMTVKDRLASNKPVDLEQGKYDDSKNVPIIFKVPDQGTDKPTAGTVYTVVTVSDDGTETPTTYTYEIPAEGSERIPGTKQTIKVPKSELEGKKVIIKAEEPDKTPTNSDPLDLDFTPPTITPDARDERWRRWTDIDVQLSEALEGPMELTYKENGEEKSEKYDTKEALKYAIERLKLKDNISDMKINGSDKFGNEGYGNANYQPIGQTQIIVSPIRAGKNFVIVKATEANTKVVVNVYESGTLLDSYKRDKYFDFEGEKPTPKATVTMTLAEINKPYRLRIKDESGNNYKLQAGDVIDIVGTIGEKGPDYKITNPFTEIVK